MSGYKIDVVHPDTEAAGFYRHRGGLGIAMVAVLLSSCSPSKPSSSPILGMTEQEVAEMRSRRKVTEQKCWDLGGYFMTSFTCLTMKGAFVLAADGSFAPSQPGWTPTQGGGAVFFPSE